MANSTKKEEGLEDEIAQLRDLLGKAANKVGTDIELEDLLPVLDSVGRAAPQLARLMKAQRELESEELDPAALLKRALAELEADWPELKECKERLRGGGGEQGKDDAPTEMAEKGVNERDV